MYRYASESMRRCERDSESDWNWTPAEFGGEVRVGQIESIAAKELEMVKVKINFLLRGHGQQRVL